MAGDLPLKDPRWITLEAELGRLAALLGDYRLAILEFNEMAEAGGIRSLSRRTTDGVRERLPPTFWADYHVVDVGDDDDEELDIMPRRSGLVYIKMYEVVVFVWQPDTDKYWPRYELPSVPNQRLEANAAAIDPPITDNSTQSRVNDEQRPQKDERQSRRGARRVAAQRLRAQAVLKRLFPNHDYPPRLQVPDSDLWRLFCDEWQNVEGRQGVSPNLRPSRSTVLREVGRKDD